MYLRKIDTEEFKTIYNEYMVVDFPDDELKPMQRMIDTMNQGLCFVLGLMDKDILKAYAVFILPPDGSEMLLDYFAVLKVYRGQNIGHEFFKVLSPYVKEMLPQVERMYIECERIDETQPDNQTRIRRIEFYKSCGCKVSGIESCVFGVSFSILYFMLKKEGITDEREPSEIACESIQKEYSELDNIYRAMFSKQNYDTQVRIWEK